MTPPDTETEEPTEQEEALYEAVATQLEDNLGFHGEERVADFMIALRDPIAAIVRHEIACALTEQAHAFDRQAAFFAKQQNAMYLKGDQASADVYTNYVDHNHRAATKLREAAADKIAEGYEWQCASGRGCCSPVPDAGDECARCHAEGDDEDRWAE
jgi:hypothetical protein